MRRAWSLVALGASALAAACGGHAAGSPVVPPPDDSPATSSQKGMFELTSADFQEHTFVKLAGAAKPTSTTWAWRQTLVTVSKGQSLLLEATGQIHAQTMPRGAYQTFEPDGSFGWPAGARSALPGHAPYALFGRIGESVFGVGNSRALAAPSDGRLWLLVNGCESCAADSGSFDVSVHTLLQEGVAVASAPLLADQSILDTVTLTLPVGLSWINSGVLLERGRKVLIEATGSTAVAALGEIDANGRDDSLAGSTALVPAATPYRLFGRIGEHLIRLGASAAFLAPADGSLELGINVSSEDAASGTFSVTVAKGVRPAQGLESAAAGSLSVRSHADVSGEGLWQATELQVERGQPLVISATGALSGDRVLAALGDAKVSADGSNILAGAKELMPSWPLFGLYGRIGAQVFPLGSSAVILAPASGLLELGVNASRCQECQDCSACNPADCDWARCVDCASDCAAMSGSFAVDMGLP
jgi:hypothetical protein